MSTLPLFESAEGWRSRRALYARYEALETRYHVRSVDPSLGRLFNFSDNTQSPVHGWYMFKEGFSAQLVGLFLNEFHVPRAGGRVVDPFCGSGTTVLEAQLRGYDARGVEVNPFFVQVGSTKLQWNKADITELRHLIDAILARPVVGGSQDDWPELTSFRRLYPEDVLSELFRLKGLVSEVTPEGGFERRFLLLGLSSILELTSKAYKTGKGLKFRKRQQIASPAEVRERVRSSWLRMLDDVRQLGTRAEQTGSSLIVRGDARALPFEDACADLILYSPPYANTFDYNEVYKLEMWFLGHVSSYGEWRKVKEASLRSHVSLRLGSQSHGNDLLEEALAFVETPARGEEEMLRAYFADMGQALVEQRRIAREGAHIVIVVGNSSYRCVPIPTDLILAAIAESAGLRVKEIRVGRRLNTSSQQMAIYKERDPEGLKFVRESAVILER